MNPFASVISRLGIHQDSMRELAVPYLLLRILANQWDAAPDPIVLTNPAQEVLRRLSPYRECEGYRELERLCSALLA